MGSYILINFLRNEQKKRKKNLTYMHCLYVESQTSPFVESQLKLLSQLRPSDKYATNR